MEVFCGFFTGKPPVKNPLAGQTNDFFGFGNVQSDQPWMKKQVTWILGLSSSW